MIIIWNKYLYVRYVKKFCHGKYKYFENLLSLTIYVSTLYAKKLSLTINSATIQNKSLD